MTYFNNIRTLEALKKAYRELAMLHHPDRGGDTATMQAINAEYDEMHARLMQSGETAVEFRRSFYEEQGWTGDRYDTSLSMDAITKIIRAYCKGHYPDCKFSVTRKDYNSITVALMEAPFEAIPEDADDYTKRHSHTQHATKCGTKEAREIMEDIELFANSYNYDHSDIYTDYFDRNFYLWLEIGKWDKPFIVNTSRVKRSRNKTVQAA